ncbi:MAG TPA: hypothetical protein VM491_01065, partial [Burkholderiaceae bacterium]|nr:hypothetical protein [Burkholderiaceae bacterium]
MKPCRNCRALCVRDASHCFDCAAAFATDVVIAAAAGTPAPSSQSLQKTTAKAEPTLRWIPEPNPPEEMTVERRRAPRQPREATRIARHTMPAAPPSFWRETWRFQVSLTAVLLSLGGLTVYGMHHFSGRDALLVAPAPARLQGPILPVPPLPQAEPMPALATPAVHGIAGDPVTSPAGGSASLAHDVRPAAVIDGVPQPPGAEPAVATAAPPAAARLDPIAAPPAAASVEPVAVPSAA